MGYHKDTKVWYKHDVSEGAFTGTVQVIDDALLPSKSFSYADKAGVVHGRNYRLTSDGYSGPLPEENTAGNQYPWTLYDVWANLHSDGRDHRKTIFPLKTWGSVADAKADIFNGIYLAKLDEHCDRQEWALETIDGDPALKLTRDWKTPTSYATFETEVATAYDNLTWPTQGESDIWWNSGDPDLDAVPAITEVVSGIQFGVADVVSNDESHLF